MDRSVRLLKTVTMIGADGTELLTASDTFVSATESTIGWATRVADMRIDNVRVLTQAAEETTTAAPETATDPETTAPQPVTETDSAPVTDGVTTTAAPAVTTEPDTAERGSTAEPGTTTGTVTETVDDSLTVWILIAVMLVALGVTGGVVTVRKRKQEKE